VADGAALVKVVLDAAVHADHPGVAEGAITWDVSSGDDLVRDAHGDIFQRQLNGAGWDDHGNTAGFGLVNNALVGHGGCGCHGWGLAEDANANIINIS